MRTKNTLLLVEDEEDTAALIKTRLEQDGYAVVHARDGRQATDLLETIAPPALILLDMIVPYVNGFELLRLFRQHPDWKDIPILMVSANGYGPDIQRAFDEGATDYVVKTKGLAGLLDTIGRFVPPAADARQPAAVEGTPSSISKTRQRQTARRAEPSRKAA